MSTSLENATNLRIYFDSIEHQTRNVNALSNKTSNFSQKIIQEANTIISNAIEKIEQMLPLSQTEENILNKSIEKALSYSNHSESDYSQKIFKRLSNTVHKVSEAMC